MIIDNQSPDFAHQFWKVGPLLQRALDEDTGEYSLNDVFEYVLAGDMQLWVFPEFAAVTEILKYPRKTMVLVRLIAGDLQSILDKQQVLVNFAEMVGAEGIELTGRRGWVKVLNNSGWRETAVRMVREI